MGPSGQKTGHLTLKSSQTKNLCWRLSKWSVVPYVQAFFELLRHPSLCQTCFTYHILFLCFRLPQQNLPIPSVWAETSFNPSEDSLPPRYASPPSPSGLARARTADYESPTFPDSTSDSPTSHPSQTRSSRPQRTCLTPLGGGRTRRAHPNLCLLLPLWSLPN